MSRAGPLAPRWTHAQRIATLRWLGFTVVLGTLPVVFAVLAGFAGAERRAVHPLQNGDLYLVSSMLCFTALGELIGRTYDEDSHAAVLLAGAVALALGALAALLFAAVTSTSHPNVRFVEWSSVASWPLGVLIGVICLLLSERKPVTDYE